MRRIALVLVLASALALAGCLGGGGGGSGADAASADDGTGPNQADDGSADNDTEEEGEPVPEWNRTAFDGDAPGPNAVFVFTPGPTHNLTVVDGTMNLTVNATSGDGEVLVDIYPPDCEESDNQRGESCSHTADTEAGGQWSTEDPEAGTWQIRVSKADPGTGSTSYEVTADRLEAPTQ